MTLAAIGLGSSLGDRHAWLELAVRKLDARPDCTVLRTSRWVRTPPMRGGTARGWFLNGVVLIETTATPEALLHACRALEDDAARRRKGHWGDRTLDLDLLVVDGVTYDDPWLILPHPGIAGRPFVLDPLIEVWPEAKHPTTGVLFADLPRDGRPRPVRDGLLTRYLHRR
ncbi:MAG: 2-amino-4-hydroxy-6-hydroxymethyldihydropteridine diphosphokinase [Proteobacteria bacterium]|nr:2-amino-4-hydroxy-6-hydroxymethyldihydropteridine diphosphokinase [Pseudomonadota bacterium]